MKRSLVALSGRSDPPGDQDAFCISLRKGERRLLRVESRALGRPLDPVLRVLEPSGKILAESDGARLGAMTVPPAPVTIASATPPPVAPVLSPPLPIGVQAPPTSTATPTSTLRSSTRMHAPQRIAIFNHKGGTGKTTTSVSIAAGLAARGLRVLLVDTDSQGNVSVSLGVKAERTLYHVLVMGMRATDVAVKVRENLDMVISNETLAAAELYLAGKQNRDRVLRSPTL